MDRRLEQDVPAHGDARPEARRFAPVAEQDHGAVYPMAAPAAAVAAFSEEEPLDVAPAAGHVNV